MTNKAHVQDAITIMKRDAKNLNLYAWQELNKYSDLKVTTEEVNSCGMAACFGGYVAVSKEFQRDDGSVYYNGAPTIGGWTGSDAIGVWLGIGFDVATDLCGMGDFEYHEDGDGKSYELNTFYGKHLPLITAQDVIEKLEKLLED